MNTKWCSWNLLKNCIPKKTHTVSELKRTRSGAVLTARFNKNGNYFTTAGEDKVIRLWDTRNVNLLNRFRGHECEVRDVCVTVDDSKLSSCGGDGQVLYWDLSTQCLVRKYGGHNDGVNAVRFNEFGSVIVSADSCVRLWDCRSPSSEPVQIFDTFNDSVTSLCLRRTEIIAGSLDGSLQEVDLRNNKRLSHNLGPPVKCISMSDTEISILASCLNSTIQYLQVDTNYIEPLGVYKGHKCESSKVGCCFTHGCSNVVAGSEDGRVFMWNFMTGAVDAVTSVDYHPTDDSLLSASMDGSVGNMSLRIEFSSAKYIKCKSFIESESFIHELFTNLCSYL